MLHKVEVAQQVAAKDILELLSQEQRKDIEQYVQTLRQKTILHVSATPKGGGVAELLQSVVPYMNALGIDTSWYVIDAAQAGEEFFRITNRIHNALQGLPEHFSQEEWVEYMRVNEAIAHDVGAIKHDVLVLHDSQPLAAVQYIGAQNHTVCVIHIDISKPHDSVRQLFGYMQQFQRIVVSNKGFIHESLPQERVHIIPPAIDPFVPKQRIVPVSEARAYVNKFGIPLQGNFIVQVSRFDIWKNPHGLVQAFQVLQDEHKDILLALIGFQEARDNPQAAQVFQEIEQLVKGNKQIFLFFDPERIGGAEHIQEFTAMAQNAADVIVQNSTREGFGLTVTEAMWKEKPVIGGPASGIRLQIEHGKNGYIAENTNELVQHLDYVLSHRQEAQRVAQAGKRSVRDRFLMPRYVSDHLRVYKGIVS